MRLFISYSHKDRKFVKVLSQALEHFGIDVWLDDHHLGIGDYLSQRIANAIEKVDFVIVVISPHSVLSQWVTYELSLALSLERTDNKVRLLPLVLQDAKLPDMILGRLFADFRTAEMMDRDFRRLLRRLGISEGSFDRSQLLNMSESRKSLHTRITEVRAPICGTFYRGLEPFGNPFVTVGSQVMCGDVLGIIENKANSSLTPVWFEIESEVQGRIQSIPVEDGGWIEFDEPIFLIEERW